MDCRFSLQCGGCVCRDKSIEKYQKDKVSSFAEIMQGLKQSDIHFGEPVFIKDGSRRRASLAFSFSKGQLTLGFNQARSNELVDISECLLLTPKINHNLANLRDLLSEICRIKVSRKKGKKIETYIVNKGDVLITEAFNGLDIVLEFDEELALEHRMVIFELAQKFDDIIRISHRRKVMDEAETVLEKIKPFIKIADYEVYISAGTFLQASDDAEKSLINLVLKYIGDDEGKIADLFCGIGTFSYPLSKNLKNKILAIDSSKSLLEGFRQSINKNVIPNISIEAKNLFKYPLYEAELKEVGVVVFDPPRAGAFEQVKKIASIKDEDKPHKIVAISCNPNSFIKDANVLIDAGYYISKITMVDQFIYSNHYELAALFVKK